MNLVDGSHRSKPFAFSHSRLTAYESCPRRHWHDALAPWGDPRRIVEPDGEQRMWGKRLHLAAERCLHDGAPLPAALAPSLDTYIDLARALPGMREVERRMTITDCPYRPTTWKAANAWLRGIADVCAVDVATRSAVILDLKSGKPAEDDTQLGLLAWMTMLHEPTVDRVAASFFYVRDEDVETLVMERGDIPEFLDHLLPRVDRYRTAYDAAEFPPLPGGLCRRHCAVTTCEFRG